MPPASHTPDRLELIALREFPLVAAGDDLGALILHALELAGERIHDDDILAVAQKIVSKAEDRQVSLADVRPSAEAKRLALANGKDPRFVEVILRESRAVVRSGHGVIITEHLLGFVTANSGVDQSNISDSATDVTVLLLPENPDRSARALREALQQKSGCRLGVLIIDSSGRAWRNGIIGQALGVAGLPPLLDLRGTLDLFGRELQVTQVALADAIAAAASMLMGEGAEGKPVVIVRGLHIAGADDGIGPLLRPKDQDLFR